MIAVLSPHAAPDCRGELESRQHPAGGSCRRPRDRPRGGWAAVVRLAAVLLDAPGLTLSAIECDDILGDLDGWDQSAFTAADEEIYSGEAGSIAATLGLADLNS